MLTASTQNSTPFLFQRLLWRNYLIQKTIIMTYERSVKPRTKCANHETRGMTASRKPNIAPSMLRILALTQPPRMQPRVRLLHRLPNLNSRPIRQPQTTSQRRQRHRQLTKSQHRRRLCAYNLLALALSHRHRHPHPRSVTNLRGRQGLVCLRRLSVRQDHTSFPQRTEMRTESTWQIGRV